jgi:hypothetical protein
MLTEIEEKIMNKCGIDLKLNKPFLLPLKIISKTPFPGQSINYSCFFINKCINYN